MQIEFAAGEAGYYEARTLYAVAQRLLGDAAQAPAERALVEAILARCVAYVSEPEFAPLHAAQDALVSRPPEPAPRGGLLRNFFGPSPREIMLSEQRSAALERAERAERSSFAALAEMTTVARERDEALRRLRLLESDAASSEA